MCRRCVVCGKYAADNDCEFYHYPKNKREALIWQRSMGAFETCVDTIQEQCCVCIKHIPQFVELAQKQAALMTAKSADQMNRPSLSVLLLPGATLPPYCGKSEETKSKESKDQEDDKLDEDIIVKEFRVKDCGANFPDIDETEVTVLRTPVQNDEELMKNMQSNKESGEQCGDSGNMTDCTDVLLLSRSQKNFEDARTSCQCDLSPKICPSANSCPSHPEINYDFDQPRVGCECERKIRNEMNEIIKHQQKRICELEYQLCRQNDWHFSMQQKLNELYSEFGRLEPPEELGQPDEVDLQTQSVQWNDNSNAQVAKPNQVRWSTEEAIKSSPEKNITRH
ncbi:uncharacterized protein LOC117792728 [Drosophila innubila]|uniref:uncharacterized protein LOC117792728 n=1 Tax=Drosophila innubila TaxID=198719 RepID=UPI00148B7237|nr:uncharacterized protein LOC117792728 [Drosophila innubila]